MKQWYCVALSGVGKMSKHRTCCVAELTRGDEVLYMIVVGFSC
jgi:hypothetical protein